MGYDIGLTAGFDPGNLVNLRKSLERSLSNININVAQNRIANIQSGGPVNTPDLKNLVNQQKQYRQAISDVDKVLKDFRSEQDRATTSVHNFSEKVGQTTKRLAAYLIPASIFFQLSRAIGVATSEIKEFDAQINKLTQVLEGNKTEARAVADAVFDISVKYGQAAGQVLDVTTTLAQAGRKFQGEGLIKALDAITKSNLAATFGDIRNTVEGSIAFLSQFNLTASDTVEVLDVANQLSKKFAVEASNMFTAVQTGGAAFAAAGGSMKEFMATVTALRDLTRLSPSTIGVGINTVVQRSLRPDVIRFQEEITQSVGGIRDADGALLDFNKRLEQVAKASLDFSEEGLQGIVEKMSDIRQGKLFIALLRDIQRGLRVSPESRASVSSYYEAMEESNRAAGSLARDAAIGLERLDVQVGRIGARFSQVFKDMSQDPAVRQLVKEFAFLAGIVADALDSVKGLLPLLIRIGTLKLFTSLLPGGGLGGFFRGFGQKLGDRAGLDPGTISALTSEREPRIYRGRGGFGGFGLGVPTGPSPKSPLSGLSHGIPVRIVSVPNERNVGLTNAAQSGLVGPKLTRNELIGRELITRLRQSNIDPFGTFSKKDLQNVGLKAPVSQLVASGILQRGQTQQGILNPTRITRANQLTVNPAVMTSLLKKTGDAMDATINRNKAEAIKRSANFPTFAPIQRTASDERAARISVIDERLKQIKLDQQKSQQTIADIRRGRAQARTQSLLTELRQNPILQSRILDARLGKAQQFLQSDQGRSYVERTLSRAAISKGDLNVLATNLAKQVQRSGRVYENVSEASLRSGLSTPTLEKIQRVIDSGYKGNIKDLMVRYASKNELVNAIRDEYKRRGQGYILSQVPEYRRRVEARLYQQQLNAPITNATLVRNATGQEISAARDTVLQKEKEALHRLLKEETNRLRKAGATEEQIHQARKNIAHAIKNEKGYQERLTTEQRKLVDEYKALRTSIVEENQRNQRGRPGLIRRGYDTARSGIGTGLRATGQAAGTAIGAGLEYSGFITQIAGSVITQNLADFYQKQFKNILDSNGDLLQDFDKIIEENRKALQKAAGYNAATLGVTLGAPVGAAAGTAIGAKFGTLGGPLGTLIGAGAGALIGGGIAYATGKSGSSESSFRTVQGQLLEAASLARETRRGGIVTSQERNAARPLLSFFDNIDKEYDLNRRTGVSNELGTGKTSLLDALALGTGFEPKDVTTQIRQLLETEQGAALLSKEKDTSSKLLERLVGAGAISGGESAGIIEGKIRVQRTNDLAKALEEEAKFKGQAITKTEALARASVLISEEFRKLNGSTNEFQKSLKALAVEMAQQKVSTDKFINSFNFGGASLDLFADQYRTGRFGAAFGTKQIALDTQVRGLELQTRTNYSATLLGRGGAQPVPENVGQILVEQIIETLRRQGGAQGFGQAIGVINDRLGNLLGTAGTNTFADVLVMQNRLEEAANAARYSLSNKDIDEARKEQADVAVGNILDRILGRQIQLSGDEASRNTYNRIRTQATRTARSNAEAFKENPVEFVAGLLKEFADGKIFVERVNAQFAALNQTILENNTLFQKEMELRERIIQFETQSVNTRIGLIRGREQGGETTEQIIDALRSLNIGGGIGLEGAFANLQNAQSNYQTFLRFRPSNEYDFREQEARLILETNRAYNVFNEELQRSNNGLLKFRSVLDGLSKSVSAAIQTNRTLGGLTPEGREEVQVYGNVLDRQLLGIFGPGGAPQNIMQLLQMDPERIRQAIVAARGTAGSDLSRSAIEAGQRLGTRRLAGSGLRAAEGAEILEFLQGASVFDKGGLSINELISNAKEQFALQKTVQDIELQQLHYLEQINDAIRKRLNMPISSGNPNQTPLGPNNPPTTPVVRDAATQNLLSQVNNLQDASRRARQETVSPWNMDKFIAATEANAKKAAELSATLDKLIQVMGDRNGGGAKVQVQGNLNVNGFDGVGRDVATRAIIIAALEGLGNQLNNSPEELALKEKLATVIRMLKGGNDKGANK